MASPGERPKVPLEGKRRGLSRRDLVKWMLGAGAAGAAGVALTGVLSSLRPSQRESKWQEPVAAGDRLVFALGANKGQIIRRDNIPVSEAVLAFPEGKDGNQDNLIMLCHLDPATLEPPTQLEWTAEGFVAYSAICTHLGCTVYFSHEAMENIPHPHLHSPCHGGIFDPQRGAIVLGGPPPRPLPQLPIKINDQGEIVAAGWFEEPPGVVPEEELKRWHAQHPS